jgi:hypothetical protein
MKPIRIDEFGRGRVTAVAQGLAPFGSASDSLNLLHTTLGTAELRPGIDRVWATRTGANAVLFAFEYVKSDLSIVYLTKVLDTLYTFDALTPATALGSIEASMTSGFISSVCNANGKVFIADSGKNYSSDGTSAGTHELQLAAQSSGWITLASAGAASGNPAGTVYYAFTRTQLYDGAEHAPSAALAVTRTVNQGVTVTNAALVFTDPWTTVNLYRTKAGGTQFYLVATGLTSGSFPYADTSLDDSRTTASTVHGENVITASIEKPEAAKHLCFHRGYLFLGNLAGNLPSRLRWSRPLEPTQFENFTTARRDIGKLDGGEITGMASFRGSLLIFKRTSIWIMNGDDDSNRFVFAETVAGIGCVAPRTIRVDGDNAVYFLSARGVCSFDLSRVTIHSQSIEEEIRDLLYTTYGANFVAGIEPRNRLYLLSVTPSGATTNTKTHVLQMDTGRWLPWGRFSFGMGQIVPTCFSDVARDGPIRNSVGNVKLYMGTTTGYLYELDTTTGCDGVTSGDKTGTVTGATATTTTCSAAAFRTTGNGLTGLPMTVRRAADNSYETVLITSATATVITHPALSGTAIVAGDTIFIGAIQGTLAFNGSDLQTVQKKRIGRILVRWKEQTHAIPLRIGYTLDDGSAPTATTEYAMNNNAFGKLAVHRPCQLFAPYLDIIGVSCALELIGIEYTVMLSIASGPTR